MNVQENIKQYLESKDPSARDPLARCTSFDYCYNYFQSFRENNDLDKLSEPNQIQVSCLQLAFYLASWGMLRGRSFLLEKSVKFYAPMINKIVDFNKTIWEIDADCYTDTNIEIILDCRNMIRETIRKGDRGPTDTLVTKIMLGVFGNVPAFDTFFIRGFKKCGFGAGSLNKKSLKWIRDFYQSNKDAIDEFDIATLDFASGKGTSRKYTKAKLIDMIGHIEGGGS